ncbi:hypothetical protein ACFQ8E_15605 [Isoptericola sp. NPDC056573]|uniref:hypothetical protein n=1 Tax=Isoptericola sp. NPDC056573 TaxID=3345868 RepID=UPI0036AAD5B6
MDPVAVAEPAPARPRRQRALVLGAVGLAAVAAVAVPWVASERSAARERSVATAVEACQTITPTADLADTADPMRVIASEVRDDAVLTFVAADAPLDRTALCADEIGAADAQGGVGFGADEPRELPAPGIATLMGTAGTGDQGWSGAWGYAGDDVVALTVTTDAGDDVAATVTDGYWVVWWPSGDAGALTTGTLRTRDGSTGTVDLGV